MDSGKRGRQMNKLLYCGVAAFALTACAPALAQDTPKQGGEIVITYKDDVATLDPAIGYDWQNWSMIKSLFDGLMDYEPGTTELRAGPRRELRDFARRH